MSVLVFDVSLHAQAKISR